MNDPIERDEVLGALLEAGQKSRRYKLGEIWELNFDEIRDAIATVQSAQRTGRWIIKDNPRIRWYRVTCSECGEDVTSVIPMIGFFPNVKPLWDFCPNCGCAMKGEEE